MKKYFSTMLVASAVITAVLLLVDSCDTYGQLPLVKNGQSNYSIVIAVDAGPLVVKAASEMDKYIKAVSGADLPVMRDNGAASGNEILVGNSAHLKQLGINVSAASLGDDGFLIQTVNNHLVIIANKDKGVLYGVYTFLESYLGCRMYSSDVMKIPKKSSITLSKIKDREVPAVQYRDLYYSDAYDETYTNWHKLDHFDQPDKIAGQPRLWGEIWSSSFMYVIPAKTYFQNHPEFFALNGNKRTPDQLCLTNDAMFDEYVKNFTNLMKRFPDSKIWSVAANDNLAGNCQCDKCQAINKKAGSPMGTLLTFVNKIAARFPDKIIATQAYLRYEEPPQGITPARNVMIVECGPYYLSRAEAYATSQSNEAKVFRRRLDQWLAIAPNIRIWDYVTDFPYLMCPFPNFHTLQPNIKYFAEQKNIKNLFEQGNMAPGGEFPELRAYLLAKLLWNPDLDVDEVMNDFLNGYYGQAGPYIRQYIDLMTSSVVKSNIPLLSQDHPHKHYKDYLAPALLKSYNDLFDKAENAVSDQADVLERVKVARLPLIYAMLEMSKMVQIAQKGLAANNNGNAGVQRLAAAPGQVNFNARSVGYSSDQNIMKLLDYFVGMCKKHGIQKMAEYPTTVDSFSKDFTKYANDKFK